MHEWKYGNLFGDDLRELGAKNNPNNARIYEH